MEYSDLPTYRHQHTTDALWIQMVWQRTWRWWWKKRRRWRWNIDKSQVRNFDFYAYWMSYTYILDVCEHSLHCMAYIPQIISKFGKFRISRNWSTRTFLNFFLLGIVRFLVSRKRKTFFPPFYFIFFFVWFFFPLFI